ncbi:MAG: TraR/DksA family transcriptional regulator [Desulfovibrio sp.]|uniref:TraR/DksA family transcriptional regulator n=1 Tax=Desulfovibrio sp. 7SRBS1 TaxID=3378064 RepID=UPI003B3BF3A6
MNGIQRTEIRRFLQESIQNLKSAEAELDHLESCADDNEYASRVSEYNMNLVMRERDARKLGDLEDALRRIDVYDFGCCEECGEDIGLARLKAQPTARLCVRCQEATEKELAYVI